MDSSSTTRAESARDRMIDVTLRERRLTSLHSLSIKVNCAVQKRRNPCLRSHCVKKMKRRMLK